MVTSDMNHDTRIAVCCYEGDQHLVIHALGLYVHHDCPVVVLSPEDSKAEIRYPGVENRYGGKRAYIGQDSLDRQREHLRLLLEFPENHFLIHDSDSVCLDPRLPDYLYAEPDVVWSNQVFDDIPEHQATFPPNWPHVAFQPPYFLSRKSIEAMLTVADKVSASPVMPFIDYYMVQLTMTAGLPWRRLEGCCSCPIAGDPTRIISATDEATYRQGLEIGRNHARTKGAIFFHSVKDSRVAHVLLELRKQYLAEHGAVTQPISAPRVRRGG